MSRKYQWTEAKYREILLGNKELEIPGLRSIARGFDANDGYSLNTFSKWSPSKRAKIRDYFHRVEQFLAQPKRIVRASGENLRKLQNSFHGGIPSKDFKVAFIPDPEHISSLPGRKRKAPKTRILKEGIAVERPGQYERIFIPFNQKELARDARAEVARAAAQMEGATLFFIQAGEYETLNGKSLSLISKQVVEWMHKYDGHTPLPKSSGNYGDNPRHHHWKKWLNGLVGFRMPKRGNLRNLIRMISEGRAENKKIVHQRKLFMRRKSRKARGE